MNPEIATLDDIAEFDDIIDVRTPAEFAEDHIPGAMNCPVLDDAQRVEIGTLYKQVSPFVARRLGGAYVSAAIGHHLLTHFQEKPKQWRPLVMCWRGGMRSGAMVTILRAVGWDARQLVGGYKAFRRQVMDEVAALAPALQWRVIAGPTGCGKTKLLQALREQGAQVIDLEGLAGHRGSVLGGDATQAQPSQKAFETALWAQMRLLDLTKPVFVEAESRKIGQLRVPEAIVDSLRAASCIGVTAGVSQRVAFLLQDYAHWINDPAGFSAQLQLLKPLHGGECLAKWQQLIDTKQFPAVFEDLLTAHYDPRYTASLAQHYRGRIEAQFEADSLDAAGIERLAHRILSM